MTGRALARKNDHLALHRRLILARSLGAGAAGLVPLPLLDDWLVATIRRGTIRRLAETRAVDLDDAALIAIADGQVPRPSWRDALNARALWMIGRVVRRALLVWAVARRAEDARKSFAVATLFDHYCARLHVGAGLHEAEGRALRAAIDDAVSRTRAGVSGRLFRRAVAGAGRALLRAPVRAVDRLTGGWIQRLLGRGDEAAAEEVVEDALATAFSGNSFVRAVKRVDAELSAAGNAWLDELIETFERAWRGRPGATA